MSIQHLINAYTPETKDVMLGVYEDDVLVDEQIKVVFIQNNSLDLSKTKALELLKLLDGSIKAKTVETDELDESGNKKKTIDFDLDFTKIIGNLGSPSMKGVEDFIQRNCKMFIKDGSEWVQVDTAKKIEVDFVFHRYAGQYFNFLIEGIKFHFAKFLPSGNGLLANLANKAVNKMQLESLKPTN
ncbi:MAG: putative phage tail assembly chaperone [Aerococcus urinaeequi]